MIYTLRQLKDIETSCNQVTNARKQYRCVWHQNLSPKTEGIIKEMMIYKDQHWYAMQSINTALLGCCSYYQLARSQVFLSNSRCVRCFLLKQNKTCSSLVSRVNGLYRAKLIANNISVRLINGWFRFSTSSRKNHVSGTGPRHLTSIEHCR
jgi:hypothetical protein